MQLCFKYEIIVQILRGAICFSQDRNASVCADKGTNYDNEYDNKNYLTNNPST